MCKQLREDRAPFSVSQRDKSRKLVVGCAVAVQQLWFNFRLVGSPKSRRAVVACLPSSKLRSGKIESKTAHARVLNQSTCDSANHPAFSSPVAMWAMKLHLFLRIRFICRAQSTDTLEKATGSSSSSLLMLGLDDASGCPLALDADDGAQPHALARNVRRVASIDLRVRTQASRVRTLGRPTQCVACPAPRTARYGSTAQGRGRAGGCHCADILVALRCLLGN